MKNKVFKNDLKYLTQQSLVSSLARYVQVDDLKLPRELFLRKVLDRIVNDLSAPIAVPRTSQGPWGDFDYRTGGRAAQVEITSLRAAPGRAKDRCSRKPLADLLHPQIFRRFLAAVRDDIERHLGAIRQTVQAGLLDGRNMDENVLAAAIRRDEAITLLAVKPFHCSTRHVALSSR
jgi:hypothetical protein